MIKKLLTSPLSALLTIAAIICVRAADLGYVNVAEAIAIAAMGICIISMSARTYLGSTFGIIAVVAVIPVAWWMYGEYTALIDTAAILGSLVLVGLHCYLTNVVSKFLQK